VPSLFTLALANDPLCALAGVVMESVALLLELPADPGSGATEGGVQRFRQRGPVLITHWGLSGPATLRLTAFAARALKAAGYRGELRIDWSDGQSQPQLDALFAEAKQDQAKRQLANWRPWPALSRRLWLALLQRCHGPGPLWGGIRDGRWDSPGGGEFGHDGQPGATGSLSGGRTVGCGWGDWRVQFSALLEQRLAHGPGPGYSPVQLALPNVFKNRKHRHIHC